MELLIFIKISKDTSVSNSGEPDQTPRFAASDLVLHCLSMSHKKDVRLIWVKHVKTRVNTFYQKNVTTISNTCSFSPAFGTPRPFS